MCDVSPAGYLEARKILDDFGHALVDLANSGRAGRITKSEFSELQRKVVEKKGKAWCDLLIAGRWGPQTCREIAARCEENGGY